MEGDGRERPQEKISGSGGCGASRTDKMLPGAASGGGASVKETDRTLSGAAPGGDGSVTAGAVMAQRGAPGSGRSSASSADVMLSGTAPGGVGSANAGEMMVLRGAPGGGSGSASPADGMLPGVEPVDVGSANASDRMLTEHGGAGGSVETGFVALLNGAVASGGVCGEGPDVHAVADGAYGASSSAAPRRKRGRPKGSKNKPKIANAPESKHKRGRPVGSKASPKRSLAMGSAEADVPPEIRIPQQEDSAAASVTVNTNESDTDELPGTIVPSTPLMGARPSRTSPARPPLIPSLYIDTLVAFSPEKEGWTKRQKTKDKYVGVGSSYLVGRVCRVVKGALFHVQWLDSQYQNKDERLNLSMIQRGNANYRSLHGNSSHVGWGHLCTAGEGADTQVEGVIDDTEECMEMFDPPMELPTSLSEVEAIRNMRFEPGVQSEEPGNLYRHTDGTTTTRLLPQFKHIFENPASASFFAYIPLSFWQQVVGETNNYARMNDIALTTPFTLDEVMAFLGVLFTWS
ncbi:unnamed protein product [Phytophthora fragariaefolia]|uniref:Unnamed protein product n=1 Tax=Phytophthora fragariaefolia TaxID=1490495 RepID=A0A9W6YCV6_9STRA|nr:unnamed protein product [Phytophthora fragariaefolia]